MFSDHDNLSNAAAAAPAPESEPAPNSANPETNATVESAAEPVARPTSEPAEAVNAAQETPAASASEEAKPAAETHAADPETTAAAEEAAGSEEMSKLLEEYDEKQEAAASSEVIEVKVVAYTEHGVVVDLGGKTEGLVPAAEFSDTEIPRPEPNSMIEVQRTGEHKDGFTILSYLKVLRRKTWEKIEAAFKAKETITGKVVDRIKGGLVVDIGVRAFLPGSQFDLRPTQNLDALAGTEVQVRVTKLNRRRGNVVVSRRALLEEELHAKRGELMEKLSEGQVVHGHVKNVTEYGAFVDLGGIDGLLHLTDLSWGRVKHPSDVVKPEQELDVIILKFDKEKQRVSLGLKQLMADPWVGAAEKYPAGGKVSRGHGGYGQGSQHRGVRRVHRNRGWLRRACACGRRELDRAREKPARGFQEGRRYYREGVEDRSGESPCVAGHQAGKRHLGRLVQAAQGRANRERQGFAHRHVRRVRRTGREHRSALPQYGD